MVLIPFFLFLVDQTVAIGEVEAIDRDAWEGPKFEVHIPCKTETRGINPEP